MKHYHKEAFWREKLTEEDMNLLNKAMLDKTQIIFDRFIFAMTCNGHNFNKKYNRFRNIALMSYPKFRITIPDNATNITYIKANENNHQIIFLLGSKFEVRNIERKGKYDLIEMEYINNIYAEEMVVYAEYMKKENLLRKSKKLRISELIGEYPRKEDLDKLGDILSTNTFIKIVSLESNNIEEGMATGIWKALAYNQTITKLQISGNNLGVRDAQDIGEALKINTKLIFIDLSDNNISDEGAISLSEGIAHNTSLEILKLTKNKIGKEGGNALFDNFPLFVYIWI